MGHKSYHEHLIEEKEKASQALSKAKSLERSDQATIYLDDHAHTIILVRRSALEEKISKLKKQGQKIKRIL